MSDLQTAIDNLNAKFADLKNLVDQAEAALIAVPQRIADAIAQAQASGATPEQLQALNELSNSITVEVGELSSAIAAQVPAPAPPEDPNP